jgi:clan AA aspartic protease (TIGR02281 family)
MPFPHYLSAFGALLLALILPACQQNQSWLVSNSPSQARVTMKLMHHLPFVPVRINGQRQEFLLDTGASDCVVTPEMVRRMGLPLVGAGARVKTASGDSLDLAMTEIPELEFGGMVFRKVPAIVHDCATPRQFFPNLQGVLGFSLFQPFLLTMDYPRSEVRVSSHQPLARNNHSVVPMQLHVGVPQVPVSVGPVRTYADIDTGSNGGLEMRLSSLAGRADRKLQEVGTSYSISTAYKSFGTQLHSPLYIGRVEIDSPFVELTQGDQRIGGAVLHDFTVTFDYRSRLIALERPYSP